MRTSFALVSFAGMLVLAASACFASEAIDPGAMELYPTYNAVGIEIPYTGDDDGNAAAEFVWRKGGQESWRNGVDMTIDREKRFIWASVYPLDEGTAIEVRVTVTDPSATLAPITGAVTTRTMVLENSGGAVYYVSPEGDDSNPGTEEKPFRTLAHAAGVVRAGQTVLAMTGVYHEGDLFAGLAGEPGRPIVFAAAPGHKPVIDGSIVIERGSDSWVSPHGTLYAFFDPETTYVGYIAQDGRRMLPYGSMKDFEEDTLGFGRSWRYDPFERYLFVRTGDDSQPQDHEYRVAVYQHAVLLSGTRYVVVRGFEMRYFGFAAVRISGGAVGNVIADCNIHNCTMGVYLAGETTENNAIWNNDFAEPGLNDFTWSAIKASEYGRQAILGFAGRGTSICHNRIDGYFDGIAPSSWLHPDELVWNRDMDIMYNEIRNTGDDAIEPDGCGVNMRIHGNRIRNCFVAISLAPVERGPVYCTRNDATYYMLMFKLNVGGCESLGWAYSYHNSGYSLAKMGAGGYGGIPISFPGRGIIPISNKVFKNNAIIGNLQAIKCAYPGTFFDHDCFYHVPGERPLNFSWEVKGDDGKWQRQWAATIEQFRTGTGHEANGMYADPLFKSTPGLGKNVWGNYGITSFGAYPQVSDVTAGDLSLKPASPCIDAGAVIRGINEDYRGAAPDIGAFESDGGK